MNNQARIEQLEEEIQELEEEGEELGEVAQELNGIHFQLNMRLGELQQMYQEHSHLFDDSNAMNVAIEALDDAVNNVKACWDELTH